MFGTPEAYNHYAVGWAHAMDTPYQWTKQVASHWGGTRNGTIIRWPNGIKAKGEIRHQFHHVIDVAPTDPRGGRPARAHLRPRDPAGAATRASRWPTRSTMPARRTGTTTQYFEMFVNRGIYHRGWTAVTRHSHPLAIRRRGRQPIDDDVWELYAPDDWTQARNMADQSTGAARATCSASS